MARIAGVDLPRDKRVEIALTYLYGVGLSRSQEFRPKNAICWLFCPRNRPIYRFIPRCDRGITKTAAQLKLLTAKGGELAKFWLIPPPQARLTTFSEATHH